MSFETDLKAHLASSSEIAAIVGARIFPVIAPENVSHPCVTYSVVGGDPHSSLDGFTSGTTRYVVQVDCWAKSFNAVMNLALAVRDQLAQNAATFRSVLQEFPLLDDYEPQTKIYRRAVQVACWHQE